MEFFLPRAINPPYPLAGLPSPIAAACAVDLVVLVTLTKMSLVMHTPFRTFTLLFCRAAHPRCCRACRGLGGAGHAATQGAACRAGEQTKGHAQVLRPCQWRRHPKQRQWYEYRPWQQQHGRWQVRQWGASAPLTHKHTHTRTHTHTHEDAHTHLYKQIKHIHTGTCKTCTQTTQDPAHTTQHMQLANTQTRAHTRTHAHTHAHTHSIRPLGGCQMVPLWSHHQRVRHTANEAPPARESDTQGLDASQGSRQLPLNFGVEEYRAQDRQPRQGV